MLFTRNLQATFKAHPEFDETSTIVVSPFQNTMAQYAPNDLLMSYWNLDSKDSRYADDFFVPALRSYLLGLSATATSNPKIDVRLYSARMSMMNLESRLRTSSTSFDTTN